MRGESAGEPTAHLIGRLRGESAEQTTAHLIDKIVAPAIPWGKTDMKEKIKNHVGRIITRVLRISDLLTEEWEEKFESAFMKITDDTSTDEAKELLEVANRFVEAKGDPRGLSRTEPENRLMVLLPILVTVCMNSFVSDAVFAAQWQQASQIPPTVNGKALAECRAIELSSGNDGGRFVKDTSLRDMPRLVTTFGGYVDEVRLFDILLFLRLRVSV